MLDYMNAVRQAQSSGVKPVRYAISEGGNWISVEPFVKPTHVHSIEFDNGQVWDEINGWRFIGRVNPQSLNAIYANLLARC